VVQLVQAVVDVQVVHGSVIDEQLTHVLLLDKV
jgi:hypothetical protein